MEYQNKKDSIDVYYLKNLTYITAENLRAPPFVRMDKITFSDNKPQVFKTTTTGISVNCAKNFVMRSLVLLLFVCYVLLPAYLYVLVPSFVLCLLPSDELSDILCLCVVILT